MNKETGFNKALSCVAFNEVGYICELVEVIGEEFYELCLENDYVHLVSDNKWTATAWLYQYLKKREIPYKKIFQKYWRELLLKSSRNRVDNESFWWKLRHHYMFRFQIYFYFD